MIERNDFMENFLFIASMLVVGLLISVLKFKFQISEKIWNVLKIKKMMKTGDSYLSSLIFVLILTVFVSFIIENLNVSQLMDQIIRGAIFGLTFLFIPSSLDENKKRG